MKPRTRVNILVLGLGVGLIFFLAFGILAWEMQSQSIDQSFLRHFAATPSRDVYEAWYAQELRSRVPVFIVLTCFLGIPITTIVATFFYVLRSYRQPDTSNSNHGDRL